MKFSIFSKFSKNQKIFKKPSKIYGGEPPYFRRKIDCFLNSFLFFEIFENIENFNFFSSFKAFLKTTPVAAIGNFNIRMPRKHTSVIASAYRYLNDGDDGDSNDNSETNRRDGNAEK